MMIESTGRPALVDRMSELIRATPKDHPTQACDLRQGLVAPAFAGLDLGLAEKLAIRAVATAAGVEPAAITAAVRETGDLGEAGRAAAPDANCPPGQPAPTGPAALTSAERTGGAPRGAPTSVGGDDQRSAGLGIRYDPAREPEDLLDELGGDDVGRLALGHDPAGPQGDQVGGVPAGVVEVVQDRDQGSSGVCWAKVRASQTR